MKYMRNSYRLLIKKPERNKSLARRSIKMGAMKRAVRT
jgi:hypothetical protein